MSDNTTALDSLLDPKRWMPSMTSPTTHSRSGLDDQFLAAARSELAAIRARVEDLELMLRAAFPDEDEDEAFVTYGTACDLKTAFWLHRNMDDPDPITLDRDPTGLPILTPEARAFLRRGEK